ncbi:hypothetical protein ACVWWN_006196 [Mycobacterium sp. URHB0021]
MTIASIRTVLDVVTSKHLTLCRKYCSYYSNYSELLAVSRQWRCRLPERQTMSTPTEGTVLVEEDGCGNRNCKLFYYASKAPLGGNSREGLVGRISREGGVRALLHFGGELVAYRDEAGAVHLRSGHCRHLGASLVPESACTNGSGMTRWHGIGPMGGTDLDAVLRNLGVSTIVAVGVSVNLAITGNLHHRQHAVAARDDHDHR